MTENALKCKSNGGLITFGYCIDENKHFQPDPIKALIVADVFKRYAMGESAKSILYSLKAQGLKTRGDSAPTYSFVTNMLKNRRYLGEYRFRDTVVENAFTPLVEPEIFDKCQIRMAENKKRPASFKQVEEKSILTGKIFCGYCGSTIYGVSGTSSTGTKHRYYHCRTAKTKKSCEKKRNKKEFLESAVLDSALHILNDAPIVNSIVSNCFELQSNKNASMPALEKQLAQAQTEINNVMNAIKQGIITPTISYLLKLYI